MSSLERAAASRLCVLCPWAGLVTRYTRTVEAGQRRHLCTAAGATTARSGKLVPRRDVIYMCTYAWGKVDRVAATVETGGVVDW